MKYACILGQVKRNQIILVKPMETMDWETPFQTRLGIKTELRFKIISNNSWLWFTIGYDKYFILFCDCLPLFFLGFHSLLLSVISCRNLANRFHNGKEIWIMPRIFFYRTLRFLCSIWTQWKSYPLSLREKIDQVIKYWRHRIADQLIGGAVEESFQENTSAMASSKANTGYQTHFYRYKTNRGETRMVHSYNIFTQG